MKATTFSCSALLCLGLILNGIPDAQAFENLDFEQAVPVLVGDYETDRHQQDPVDILPHWTVESSFFGDNFFFTYNDSGHIGNYPPIVGIFGGSDATSNGVVPIEGEYSLVLDPRYSTVFFHQTGQIPSAARSLRFISNQIDFSAANGPYPSFLEVSLGNTVLPLVELGPLDELAARPPLFNVDGPLYEYGVNIPAALIGTESKLQFTALEIFVLIDDIHFSPIPVPEPTSAAIFSVLAAALVSHCRRTRSAGWVGSVDS